MHNVSDMRYQSVAERDELRPSAWRSAGRAFTRASERLGNILAPFLILTALRDSHDNLEFLFRHQTASAIFLFGFAVLFATALGRRALIERGRNAPSKSGSGRARVTRRIVVGVGLLLSGIAFILAAGAFVIISMTGVHYAVVASAPDRDAAVREVVALNAALNQVGETRLRARAYSSTGTGNPWYMVTIGTFSFSQESAQTTLARARTLLDGRIRSDAYVYSINATTLSKRIRLLARKAMGR